MIGADALVEALAGTLADTLADGLRRGRRDVAARARGRGGRSAAAAACDALRVPRDNGAHVCPRRRVVFAEPSERRVQQRGEVGEEA